MRDTGRTAASLMAEISLVACRLSFGTILILQAATSQLAAQHLHSPCLPRSPPRTGAAHLVLPPPGDLVRTIAPDQTGPNAACASSSQLLPSKCCDDHLSPANTLRSSSASAAVMPACVPRWARLAMRMTTPCARASSQPSNASCSRGAASRRRPRHAARCSPSSRAFYNPCRRHSSIGYLSPIDYEHQHHAMAVVPDPSQLDAVLAPVKDASRRLRRSPAAILDRRCAPQPHCHAGRDGRMAPPGDEPKNGSIQEDNITSHQTA